MKIEIEFSFVETQKNLEILEKEGLSPIPVYQRMWKNCVGYFNSGMGNKPCCLPTLIII